jgi:hypothetical protein
LQGADPEDFVVDVVQGAIPVRFTSCLAWEFRGIVYIHTLTHCDFFFFLGAGVVNKKENSVSLLCSGTFLP